MCQAIRTGISHHSSSQSKVSRSMTTWHTLLRLSMAPSHHWSSHRVVKWVFGLLWWSKSLLHETEWTLKLCCLLDLLQSCLLLGTFCHLMPAQLPIYLSQDCWACDCWPHLCWGQPLQNMLKLFERQRRNINICMYQWNIVWYFSNFSCSCCGYIQASSYIVLYSVYIPVLCIHSPTLCAQKFLYYAYILTCNSMCILWRIQQYWYYKVTYVAHTGEGATTFPSVVFATTTILLWYPFWK